MMERISITIDKKTLKLLDDFKIKYAIDRSSTVRMIVNNFFLKQGVCK